MILSVSYNFFNGEEHIIQSIKSIRESVDYINIVFQETSNRGNECSKQAKEIIEHIIEEKLVEKVIDYKPTFQVSAQQNELLKRKIGLQDCRKAGASHFFTMDADEFYRYNEIQYAKYKIQKNNYNSTSAGSYMHVKKPFYRMKDSTNVCFITRIDKQADMVNHNYPINFVDPTRKIFLHKRNHYHFRDDELNMYHMNLVRKSIKNKLDNSSTNDVKFLSEVEIAIKEWNESDDFFIFPRKGKMKVEKVANEFHTFVE